jgi:hypothetical protein
MSRPPLRLDEMPGVHLQQIDGEIQQRTARDHAPLCLADSTVLEHALLREDRFHFAKPARIAPVMEEALAFKLPTAIVRVGASSVPLGPTEWSKA